MDVLGVAVGIAVALVAAWALITAAENAGLVIRSIVEQVGR